MNEWRVRRLVRRAAGSGRRARRSAGRLDHAVRRGGPGAQLVVDLVWSAWLVESRDGLWPLLDRWRRPSRSIGRPESEVVVAHLLGRTAVEAGLTGHDLRFAFHREPGHRARVAAEALIPAVAGTPLATELTWVGHWQEPGPLTTFCVEHGVLPADPVTRAAFLLRFGRPDQYHAADPDGTLLSAAYRAATGDERAALRAAMVHAGDLDVARVLAGDRPGRGAPADPVEIGYLADRLADRRDWPGLWALITEVSPLRAVELVERLDPDWRPPDERGDRLLDVLRETGPEARAVAATPYDRSGRIDVDPEAEDVSFAPDGSAVAVLGRSYDRISVGVYDCADGHATWRHEWARGGSDPTLPTSPTSIAWLGPGEVAITGPTAPLVRLRTTGAGPEIRVVDPALDTVVAVPAGVLGWADDGAELRLRLAGRPIGPRLDLTALGLAGRPRFAADPRTGRIAVAGRVGRYSVVTVLEPSGEPAATGRIPLPGPAAEPIRRVLFGGPDEVVTAGADDRLVWWRRDGARLVPGASRPFARQVDRHSDLWVAVAGRVRAGRDWYAPGTLVPTFPPTDAAGPIWVSPDGGWIAAQHLPSHELRRYRRQVPAVVAELADRPIGTLRPAEAEAATAPPPAGSRAAVGAARLLAACVEYRFGEEITLSPTGTPTARPDDIAIDPG